MWLPNERLRLQRGCPEWNGPVLRLPFLTPAKSAKIWCFLGQLRAKGDDVGSGWSQEALLSGAGGDAQERGLDVLVDSG